MKPIITSITVVYNGEKHLEQTIKSVIRQTYRNIEYIIIDGGSTDGTVDIIKKYENKLTYWISEKDKGLYYAMNKGIQKANGHYIGLINADDWYEPDTFQAIVEVVQNDPQIDIVCGTTNFFRGPESRLIKSDANKLYKTMSIGHQTCFVKKELYNERVFDTSYKIAADYEFVLCNWLKGKRFHCIDKILANRRDGGISSNHKQVSSEMYRVHRQYFSASYAIYLYVCESISVKMIKFVKAILLLVFSPETVARIRGYKYRSSSKSGI